MSEIMLHKMEFYGCHLAELFDTNCRIVDTEKRSFVGKMCGSACYFGHACKNKHCNLLNTYLYGCHEAYRWGGKYIFYCPGSLIFIAASVSDEGGKLSGGMVLGPIIMGEAEDTIDLYRDPEERKLVESLTVIPTEKVNHIAELMAGITESISGVSHSLWGGIAQKQENFLKSLYQNKAEPDQGKVYPIETEKELRAMILNGDKHGAQTLLNDLLGKIYLLSDFDPALIRIRMIELLSVLSRAAVDAGADVNETMWFNTACIREIQQCDDIEELSVWITGAMHRFLSYSFDFSTVKHSDTVYKVIDYIRKNYFRKITLDSIAKHVHFSKTYLSRIFKEETGENISACINRVRVERAKLLLADPNIPLVDVADLTGFEDQSYFTKVFKSIAGVSPKKFRENRNKM
jgi:two-component system response regulator YesN